MEYVVSCMEKIVAILCSPWGSMKMKKDVQDTKLNQVRLS